MTKHCWDGADGRASQPIDELWNDDAFLTQLSRGIDPSHGEDHLAQLFLAECERINSEIPAAPTLASLGIATGVTSISNKYDDAPTNTFPVVDDNIVADEPEEATVIALPRRRWGNSFAHGLVGAAAATLLIAGSGSLIYNADEGSSLYPISQKMFGNSDTSKATVVELASKLEQAQQLTDRGDGHGARLALEQAHDLLQKLAEPEQSQAAKKLKDAEASLAPSPQAPVAPEPSAPPLPTVTQTVTSTVTTTVAPSSETPSTGASKSSTEPTPPSTTEAPVSPAPRAPLFGGDLDSLEPLQ
ncbi:hypothetical protein ACK2ER_06855 [Corynebacterium diphtheriae]|uniref:hypothetical protein n=1 Tax=Corynebacterium diphtheriae TaxID=1717 RepID=UPI00390BF353